MNNNSLSFVLFGACLCLLPISLVAVEPLGVPDRGDIEYPDGKPPTANEIALGKTLFFDTRLSINRKQSCATCHNPDLGLGDGMSKGIGTMGEGLGRNTPHLYNLAWNVTFFWDGRSASLEEQALGPIQAPGEMNMPLEKLLPRLNKVPYYQSAFKEVYGDSTITKENLAKAIAAFERNIIVDDSSFDRFMKGDKYAMSPAAINGLALFNGKANCVACHDGANFTDNSFHNLGMKDGDPGRVKIDPSSGLTGAFKTSGLRNIVLTAPYMHDGSKATLEEVIRFYNRGGDTEQGRDKLIKPLALSDKEIFDLVAFLGSLTSPVIIDRPEIP